MLGVTLIADGRRQDGVGQDIGPNPPGQGAEITLHEVPMLSALGLTMTGPRPGGFGALNDRTNQICGTGRPDLRGARVGVLDRQPAEDAGGAQRWRRAAGARAVQHAGVLGAGRADRHAVDAGLGAGPDRQRAAPETRLSMRSRRGFGLMP